MACAWGRRSGDHDLADGYLADESRPIRLARAMSSRSHLSLRTHDEFVQGRPRKSRRSSTPEPECRPPGTSEADPLPLSTFPKQAVRPMLEMNRRRLRKPATRAPAADDWPTLCMPFAPLSARAGAPVVPAVRAVSVGTKNPPTATPWSQQLHDRAVHPSRHGWLADAVQVREHRLADVRPRVQLYQHDLPVQPEPDGRPSTATGRPSPARHRPSSLTLCSSQRSSARPR